MSNSASLASSSRPPIIPMDPRLRQFFNACNKGDFGLCNHLVIADPDILLSTTPHKNNCLHIAAMLGHHKFAKEVWSRAPSLFSGKNIDGKTPLIAALMAANLSLASDIITAASQYMQHDDLEDGRPLNRMLLMVDRCEENALHHAMRNGLENLALQLLDIEPGLSEQVNKTNESPMYMAARGGYSKVVEQLLEIPSSADCGPSNESALYAAVRYDHKVHQIRVRRQKSTHFIMRSAPRKVISQATPSQAIPTQAFARKAAPRKRTPNGDWQEVKRKQRFPSNWRFSESQENMVKPYVPYDRQTTYAQAMHPTCNQSSTHSSPNTRPTSPVTPNGTYFYVSPHSPTELRFPPSSQYPEWRGRCFKCCCTRHSIANCRNQRRCGKCWAFGHIGSNCDKMNRSGTNKAPLVSNKGEQGFEELLADPRPYLPPLMPEGRPPKVHCYIERDEDYFLELEALSKSVVVHNLGFQWDLSVDKIADYAVVTGLVQKSEIQVSELLGSKFLIGLPPRVDALTFIRATPDSIYTPDNDGDNALVHAILGGRQDPLDYILKTPQIHRFINQLNKKGNLPLHQAARKCESQILHPLLTHVKQDYTAVNVYGSNAVNEAYTQKSLWKTLKWNESFTFLSNVIPPMRKYSIKDDAKQMIKKQAIEEVKSLTTKYISNTSLVATLLATITFAAAFTLPGGFSSNPTYAGLPIFARKAAFQVFLIFDTIAMFSSLSVAFLCILATWEDLDFLLNYRKTTRALMWCAYGATSLAFGTGLFTVIVPNNLWLAILILVLCIILPLFSKIIDEWPLLMLRYWLGGLFQKDLIANI